jgi:PAS domain S-box-containing protein
MTNDKAEQVESLLATPDLANALESEQFKHFLDQVPIAIVVSEMRGPERIAYANPEFERLSGQHASELEGQSWSVLHGTSDDESSRQLGEAVVDHHDCVGTFRVERTGQDAAIVDAYSNVIVDDEGTPAFRLAALVEVRKQGHGDRAEIARLLAEKDTLLREIQHRVKNNLQMITALIRLETRNAQGRIDTAPFDRLAGRIASIQLVYKLLSEQSDDDQIDLGVYLSEIASSVMHAHAVEGIRLELKIDAYPVSVNVAMPTGLVVNELLTNALKHAFVGRESGTITLHSLVDGEGCRVTVADDGLGLPQGVEWPKRGKLGALIVRSLRENAKADLKVQSSPAKGTRIDIVFTRASSAPAPT